MNQQDALSFFATLFEQYEGKFDLRITAESQARGPV
jgi:hypothetical protein